MSLEAGSDIDMESDVNFLPQLVRDGRVDEAKVDSCSQSLRMKHELGLFEDPTDMMLNAAKADFGG